MKIPSQFYSYDNSMWNLRLLGVSISFGLSHPKKNMSFQAVEVLDRIDRFLSSWVFQKQIFLNKEQLISRMYPCICTYNLCLGGRYCNMYTVYILVIHTMPRSQKI